MTFACERAACCITLAIFALGVMLAPGMVAQAQDGTQVPPPPAIKRKHKIEQDEQFRSPLKDEAERAVEMQNGQDAGAGGFDNNSLQAARRRLRRARLGLGNSAQFDAPGFGMRRFNGQNQGRFAGGGFGARSRLGRDFGGDGPGLPRGAAFGQAGERGAGFGAQQSRRANALLAPGLPGLGGRKPLDLRPLNLSEAQKQRIRDIRAQTRSDAKTLRAQLQEHQRELRSLLFSPDASDAQIKQARRQLREAQERLDELNLNDWLQMRRVLTAEQRQRLPMVAPAGGNGIGQQAGDGLGRQTANGARFGAADASLDR